MVVAAGVEPTEVGLGEVGLGEAVIECKLVVAGRRHTLDSSEVDGGDDDDDETSGVLE